jgi:hypothetical protein
LNMCDRWWKMVNSLIKPITKFYMCNGWW